MRCLEGTSVGLRERQTSANLTLRQLGGNGALGDGVPGAERLPRGREDELGVLRNPRWRRPTLHRRFDTERAAPRLSSHSHCEPRPGEPPARRRLGFASCLAESFTASRDGTGREIGPSLARKLVKRRMHGGHTPLARPRDWFDVLLTVLQTQRTWANGQPVAPLEQAV
jgi:hypothetical protein